MAKRSKLEDVDRREKLRKPGAICRDLGAAPGAWIQYARRRLGRGGRVLAELALDMAAKVLKGGGDALIKVFQGAGFQELVQDDRGRFAKVKLAKPAASRARSPEMYLLAKDFRLV